MAAEKKLNQQKITYFALFFNRKYETLGEKQ